MQPGSTSPRRRRRLATAVLLLLAAASLAGCQTVSYYAQAVHGECQILWREQSCERLIASPDTPPDLRARLVLCKRLRAFAEHDLKLPADGNYSRYSDLGRRYVVWNLYAAPPFSLESTTWWYPLVGRLDYRGYFAERAARRHAARLQKRGLDVYVEGVEAYSTLGWFRDPLLNTFILHHGEATFAETIFHELAHHRVFAPGDTDFNEAFATTVGEEGARRWLRARGDAAALEHYQTLLQRNVQFVRLNQLTRQKLRILYGEEPSSAGGSNTGGGEDTLSPEQMRLGKQRILNELRLDYEKLKKSQDGFAVYDEWFTNGVNNAQLNSVATYYGLVPAFERLLAANDGDLDKFYGEVEKIARLPKTERHRRLQEPGR